LAGERVRLDGPEKRIRGVLLDYGEVLCFPPDCSQRARMAEALGLDMDVFSAAYQRERGLYDRGDTSPAEYWSRVRAGAGLLDDGLLGKLRAWDVEMWSDINQAMLDWLDRLKGAGFRTGVLSNMHADMASHARRAFEWLRHLDCSVLSCEVRLIKPERAIYERSVEALALPAAEILFIDDREVNVHAAKEAGLEALKFESVEQLQDSLARIRFPVLPLARSDSQPAGRAGN
jgi:putative hydrolase of the HAD superfamily